MSTELSSNTHEMRLYLGLKCAKNHLCGGRRGEDCKASEEYVHDVVLAMCDGFMLCYHEHVINNDMVDQETLRPIVMLMMNRSLILCLPVMLMVIISLVSLIATTRWGRLMCLPWTRITSMVIISLAPHITTTLWGSFSHPPWVRIMSMVIMSRVSRITTTLWESSTHPP
jgi:hypothetical protein